MKKIIGIFICILFIETSFTITPNMLVENVKADSGTLFSDDFNDGNNNGWIVYQGDWQVINGQYAYNYNGITNIDGITVADTTGFADITYQGKLKVTEGTPQVHFIFRFGSYSGYNNYSGYSFLYDVGLDNRWALYKFYNSGSHTKIASEPSTSSLILNHWYNIKIETSGSNIKCYVDNVKKIDTYDSTYPIGKIGLRGDVSKIYFDDIIVSSDTNINQPPNKPLINGPNTGKPDSVYSCSFIAVDPEGDNISYEIDWGDGIVIPWDGPFESNEKISRTHVYLDKGNLTIMARAKDIYGNIGDWGTLIVTMPKSKPISTPLFLQKLFQRFPLFEKILNLYFN